MNGKLTSILEMDFHFLQLNQFKEKLKFSLFIFYLFIYLFIYLSIYLFIYLFIYIATYHSMLPYANLRSVTVCPHAEEV